MVWVIRKIFILFAWVSLSASTTLQPQPARTTYFSSPCGLLLTILFPGRRTCSGFAFRKVSNLSFSAAPVSAALMGVQFHSLFSIFALEKTKPDQGVQASSRKTPGQPSVSFKSLAHSHGGAVSGCSRFGDVLTPRIKFTQPNDVCNFSRP